MAVGQNIWPTAFRLIARGNAGLRHRHFLYRPPALMQLATTIQLQKRPASLGAIQRIASLVDYRFTLIDHVLGIIAELGTVNLDRRLITVALHLQPASKERKSDQHPNNNYGSHVCDSAGSNLPKGTM